MNGMQLAQDAGLWHTFVNTIIPVQFSFEIWWGLTYLCCNLCCHWITNNLRTMHVNILGRIFTMIHPRCVYSTIKSTEYSVSTLQFLKEISYTIRQRYVTISLMAEHKCSAIRLMVTGIMNSCMGFRSRTHACMNSFLI